MKKILLALVLWGSTFGLRAMESSSLIGKSDVAALAGCDALERDEREAPKLHHAVSIAYSLEEPISVAKERLIACQCIKDLFNRHSWYSTGIGLKGTEDKFGFIFVKKEPSEIIDVMAVLCKIQQKEVFPSLQEKESFIRSTLYLENNKQPPNQGAKSLVSIDTEMSFSYLKTSVFHYEEFMKLGLVFPDYNTYPLFKKYVEEYGYTRINRCFVNTYYNTKPLTSLLSLYTIYNNNIDKDNTDYILRNFK